MEENTCVLICVTVQKDCARLIRQGAAIAKERGCRVQVLHVNARKGSQQTQEEKGILNELFSLAHEADAEMNILYEENVADAIARYAQECGASTLILGPDRSGTSSRVRSLVPPEVEIINM